MLSLISPIGVVAVATSATLGDSRSSPDASGGSESPLHLLFTWRRDFGSELFGCDLLLRGDGVTVQDDLFC